MVNLKSSDYKKLSQREAVLKRPQRFIGSLTKTKRHVYLYDFEENKSVLGEIDISPGFERVFLEILTNSADNIERSRKHGIDPGEIHISIGENKIAIYNEGLGIPTEIHPEFGVPTPQHLFSKFSCGSNFNDDSNTGSGTFGIGASCTNTYSRKFIVEIGDQERGIRYKQIFSNNMIDISDPVEEPYQGKAYVLIKYVLDFERFGYDKNYHYDDDMLSFFAQHAINIAFSTNSVVVFNNIVFDFKDIKNFVNLFRDDKEKFLTYEDDNNRLVLIDSEYYGFISLVNNMTVEGGNHIEKWLEKIKRYLDKTVKTVKVKKQDIMENIIMLYSVKLDKVEYDSASKNKLITPKGSIKIKESGYNMLKGMEKWSMISRIKERYKSASGFSKSKSGSKSKYVSVKKLTDADGIGTKGEEHIKRDLILCEGDSAKTAAEKGRTEETKKTIGVLALKGKPINTTKHSVEKIEKNKEFDSIVKSMGFPLGKDVDYTTEKDRKELRYNTISLFADPDPDGEHIKAICINMIYSIWPSFIEAGLLYHIVVPEYICRKGKQTKRFYSKADYINWYNTDPNSDKWTIKHIKGLATMSDEDIGYEIENPRRIQLNPDEDSPVWLKKAFDPELADLRKEWIHKFVDGYRYDYPLDTVSNFMTEKYIIYAIDDWKRSLPRIDGLKISQRKILYTAMKRLKSPKSEIKVGRLAEAASESTNYHHGSQSLASAIISMGRDNIGSNNIPLIKRDNQFGTRRGGDAGKPRYISAKYNSIVKYIFRPEDDVILDYLHEDGLDIEPDIYYPILSMTHVNGSKGIGTGYSIDIGNYNPHDVIQHHFDWLDAYEDNKLDEFINSYRAPKPWYRNYEGDIIERNSKTAKNKWVSIGKYTVKGNTVKVTELPVTVTIETYKKKLEKDQEDGNIKGYTDNSITTSNRSDTLPRLSISGVKEPNIKSLHLQASIPTSNINILTDKEKCEKFTVESLLHYFCEVRLDAYIRRKEAYIKKLESEIHYLLKKKEFIIEVINDELILRKRARNDILDDFKERGYFEDFLKIPLGSQTIEGVKKIENTIADKEKEYEMYVNKNVLDIWRDELDELVLQIKKTLKY